MLYISSINDEMLNRTKDAETYFNYKYGWSFAFAAISFLLTEVSCPIPSCAKLVLPYLEGRSLASHSILDHLLNHSSPECTSPWLSQVSSIMRFPEPTPVPCTLSIPLEGLYDCVPGRPSRGITRPHPPRPAPSVSSPLLLFHCRVLG